MEKKIFLILCFIFFLSGCIEKLFSKNLEQEISISFPDCQKKYLAKIADDPIKRKVGFSNTTDIGDNEAIIFVFEEEKILDFWMKDTYVPLDIIFLDKNKKVVNFFSMEPCLKKNCPIYSSSKKAKYAIEIKKGSLKCIKNISSVEFNLPK